MYANYAVWVGGLGGPEDYFFPAYQEGAFFSGMGNLTAQRNV